MKTANFLIGLGLCAMLMPMAPDTFANPPSWAPAHGWRKKNDPEYRGYTGRQWSDDYGVSTGRCNREAVATALGGVIGGALGSVVGKGDGRTVAIIVGSVLGAAIGNKIGRDLDNADRGCLGQAPYRWPISRCLLRTCSLNCAFSPKARRWQAGYTC